LPNRPLVRLAAAPDLDRMVAAEPGGLDDRRSPKRGTTGTGSTPGSAGRKGVGMYAIVEVEAGSPAGGR